MIKLNLVSKAFSLLINCFFIFTLIACSASQNSGLKDGPRVDPTSTTKVALLVPLGSGDTNQEDLANNLIRAAKMAITDHPKAKIKMKIYATSGNTLQAGRAAQRAISDGVKIIIGPLFSESAVAVGKVAAANNVNVLSFSNTLEVAGGNIFILGNTFQNTADRIIGYASTKGYKSIAIVSPETSAGSIASSAVKSAAAKIGVQVIGSYSYPFSADGIANSASGITRKIRRSKSTAVVLTTDSASGLPLLAERLQARGLPIKNIKVLGLARWDIPQSTLNTPSLRNGWFTVPDGAAINDFNSRFNKIYGTPPHPLAGVAYDGMQAFAILLEQGNLGAAQRSQLTRPQGFQGSSGRFRLLEDGSTQRALSVAEASAGALRIISSAPTRFGGSGSFYMKSPNEHSHSDALICNSELLFDKQSLDAKIQLAIETESRENLRPAIASVLCEANFSGRNAIQTAFKKAPFESARTIASYSFLKDSLISYAFDVVKATLLSKNHYSASGPEYVSVIAVGGYGRSEMAPHSDVDLLFLTRAKPSKREENLIENILYILWDMKLKIGYSTRSAAQCIQLGKSDQTIKTALLEYRYLCGNQDLAANLGKRLWNDLFKASATEYVEEKLAERAKRHKRQGGQRYMVEPNVKEGKGGLRDLQSLFWITKYIAHAHTHDQMIERGYFTQQEYDNFIAAHDYLWAVRCQLHLCAGRATEQLTFDHQVEVAKRFGYKGGRGMRGVERFMQDYFRHATHVGELTRVFLTALEAQHLKQTQSLGDRFRNIIWRTLNVDGEVSKSFQLDLGRINIKNPNDFLKDPINILRLFEEGLKTGLLIHQDAMRVVTANLHKITPKIRRHPETQRIFMSLLLDFGNPERALRRMNELGVLGAVIPEFKRIIALMQFNFYHSYTVDEHTIQCVSFLAKIEQGTLKEELPMASDILKSGVDRRVLFTAMLLHDIGKGLPEDHSIAGARLAAKIAPELGLNETETEKVVWLVENHLLMSDFAQKRDLSDPKTVSNFGKIVKTTSQLNLLTVLTVCDIMGVGPGSLNNWKAQLLRELYKNTRNLIKDGLDTQGKNKPSEIAKKALAGLLVNWDKSIMQKELNRHYPPYWQGLDVDTQLIFANLFKNIEGKNIISAYEVDPDRDATRAQFVMQDHPGIFSRLTGALALANANVIDARTYTTIDGYATPVFWIQDNDGKPFEASRLGKLKKLIEQTLSGDLIARDELKVRNKLKLRERDFKVPTEISFDNQGSDIYTIIEVDTRDRHSLLFDLTRTLANANIQIVSAVIATYGAQAVDVFYVKDMVGLKITAESKQSIIRAKLQHAIELGVKASMA